MVAEKPLWAPWRMEFILGNVESREANSSEYELLPGAEPNCFLCQAAVDPEAKRHHRILLSPLSVAVLNLYPYNNGHILVAPRRHCARLEELSREERSEPIEMIERLVQLLEQELSPEGFNIGLNLGRVAGAGLPGHIHWHLVPRWSGDTNFMPVLASTKVIPQSLDSLWEQLLQALETGKK